MSSRLLLLGLWLLLTLGAYEAGLAGGYYFDDHVNLLLNDALRMPAFDWESFRLASISSTAGPLGRPIPMATFALEAYFFGFDTPYHFKLVNLFIHLVNGLLVYGLGLRLLRLAASGEGSGTDEGRLHLYALLLTGWWLLLPINVTSVLYVVQRMTSLSALFALIGLLAYVRCRELCLQRGKLAWWWGGVLVLLVATAASAYCKENGLLTPLLAWLVEMLVFRCRMPSAPLQRYLRWACLGLPMVFAGALILYFLAHPDWAQSAYARRPFTLEERLLTQGRIVWFYIRQMLLPHSGSFSLYLDYFTLSRDFLTPWTTLPALLGHGAMLLLALWCRRRLPLVALGILWFYGGHLLESTIIPLELAYEHRNYLPGIGLLLAVIGGVAGLDSAHRRFGVVIILILVALSGLITWQRCAAMGDVMSYPIQDAERNPQSARANFDAGRTLTVMMELDPSLVNEFFPRAQTYFQRAMTADEQALAPYTGLLGLLYVAQREVPSGFVEDFAHRLGTGVPPNSTQMVSRALASHLSMDRPALSASEGEYLFRSAISNPALKGYPKAAWQANYALFVSNVLKEPSRGYALMQQALETSPYNAELRMIAGAMLIDMGYLAAGREQLERARANDRKGFLARPLAEIQKRTTNGTNP